MPKPELESDARFGLNGFTDLCLTNLSILEFSSSHDSLVVKNILSTSIHTDENLLKTLGNTMNSLNFKSIQSFNLLSSDLSPA